MKRTAGHKARKNWRRTACLAFLALDVLLMAVLGGALVHDSLQKRAHRDARAQWAGVTDAMNEEERKERLAVAIGEALALVTLRSEPVARDGRVALYLSNAEENRCAVQMTLVLAESQETLAQTGLLEPGYRLETIALDTPLQPGEYRCLARCGFFDMEDGNFLGSAVRQLLLTVQ